MANDVQYTKLGSSTRQVLDKMGNLVEVIEVKFTFGVNNEGSVQIRKDNATSEAIKKAIEDYIHLFDNV